MKLKSSHFIALGTLLFVRVSFCSSPKKNMEAAQRKRLKTENRSYFESKSNLESDSSKSECFEHFDRGNKGFLGIYDVRQLVDSLLSENTDNSFADSLFSTFDSDQNGELDRKEFESMFVQWVKPLVKPVAALLVIDMQNDFISGTLAMKNTPAGQDASEIIPVINNLTQNYNFDAVAYTKDFHPSNHISFFSNVDLYMENPPKDLKVFDTVTFNLSGLPPFEQKLWPDHCIQNSRGSEFDPKIKVLEEAIIIDKGTNSRIDSYSGFFDNMKVSKTTLDEQLREKGVTHVFVCGVATDYCVGYTALDALDLGYATVLITDASRGTDNDNIRNITGQITEKSGLLADSSEVRNLMTGKVIPLEFAKVFEKSAS